MRSDQACIHVPGDKMYKIQLMPLLDNSKVFFSVFVFEIQDGIWNQGSNNDFHQEVHR